MTTKSHHPLKYERELRGWSQEKVAEAVGTTARTVSRWERGMSLPYPYYREQLCALFDKNASELGLLPENFEQEAEAYVPQLLLPPVPPSDTTLTIEQIPAIYDPMLPIKPGGNSTLIGRHALLAQMKKRLFAGGSLALTAINGLPGVGKTALAVALASDQEVQDRFHDGILWVGLGTTPDIIALFTHWGTLLNISPHDIENMSDIQAWGIALRKAIGKRHMLLIIDDAWTVKDALAFRVGGPNCAYLVTTRIPPVAFAFADEGAITVPELLDDDALSLLQQFVPEVVTQYANDALTLVHSVGALPLALTLLGKYLSAQSFTKQPRRLQTAIKHMHDIRQRLLVSTPLSALERSPATRAAIPLSLYTAIEISDQYLSPPARDALYALSVLPAKPQSFSEEAALAVSRASLDELDELIDAGLLEVGSDDNQYMMHQTISDYARIHLQDDYAYRNLIAYMKQYIAQKEGDYDILDKEYDTFIAALDAAYTTGNYSDLVQGIHALAPFLLMRGLYITAEHYLRKAYEVATSPGDTKSMINTLLYLGEVEREQGNYGRAEHYLCAGLALARQENVLQSALLKTLGWLAHEQGNSNQAERYFREGLLIAQRENSLEQQCQSLAGLGAVTRTQGRYEQAERYLHEGLAIARQIGHSERASSLLLNLAVVASIRGNNELAKLYLQEGLTFARQLGHRERICTMLSNLGAIAIAQEHSSEAEGYLQEALTIARQIGHRERMGMVYVNLAEVATQQEKYEIAENYLQEGLTLARQIEKPRLLCLIYCAWGELYLKRQQPTSAIDAFSMMIDSIPENNQELLATAQYGHARALAALGQLQAAKAQGESSANLFAMMGDEMVNTVHAFLQSLEAISLDEQTAG